MTQMHCEVRAKRMLAEWSAGSATIATEDRGRGHADAGEEERDELLDGIWQGLSASGVRQAVSLRLLRHLAAARN